MDDINAKDFVSNESTTNSSQSETLEGACSQCARSEEQLLYLKSDFENYRRNVQKDRMLWGQNAQSRVMLDLLPIVDNFERALKDLALARDNGDCELSRFQGIELIYRELITFLDRNGVVPMAEFDVFDPSRHEAVAHVEVVDKATGMIIEVLQKGYLFKNSVLRPAKVVVAK